MLKLIVALSMTATAAPSSDWFFDPLAWTFPDPDHSRGDERFVTIGLSGDGRVVVVAHAEVNDVTFRIISARPATTRERRQNEEA